MSGIELRSRLAGLRQRVLAIAGGAGACWALGAAVALLILCMWIDLALELPAKLRIASVAVAGLCALVVFAQILILTLRNSRWLTLARRLDQSASAEGQVLAGVDLMLCGADQSGGGITAGLAQMAVARAAQIAQGAPTSAVAPLRPLYFPGVFLGCLALLIGIVALAAPRLALQQFRRFMEPLDEHPPYSPLVFEVTPGDTSVLYGGSLDIRAAVSGGAVDRVELVLEGEDRRQEEAVPMFPQADGTWRSTLTNIVVPAKYYVRAHRARSYRYSISVITLPKIESVKFRVTHPAYTHLPVYEGPLPQGGIAGLRGTKVEVIARADRPLNYGSIEWSSAAPTTQPTTHPAMPAMHLSPIATDTVSGAFDIRGNAKGALTVVDREGHRSKDAVEIPVTLLTDARPFVRILQPPAQNYASPTADIPVSISAEDDYGVGRLQLFRSLNDSRALPMDLPVPPENPTRVLGNTTLKLAGLGLKPGDTIKLYARVEDTDPDGPKGAESSIVTIEIKSEEELALREIEEKGLDAMMSKYDQARRQLEQAIDAISRFQEEMKKLPPEQELSEQQRKALEKLAKEIQEHSEAVKELSKQSLPLDLDQELRKALGPMADALDSAAKDAQSLRKTDPLNGSVADKQLEAMRRRLAQELGEFDEAVMLPLEILEKIYPLVEDAERFVLLYLWQRDLEQRMAALKGKDEVDDPAIKARMRDLQDEQQQIQEELITLLDDIDAHIKLVPDEEQFQSLKETAKDFVLKVRGSGARKKMAEAVAELTSFHGTTAHAAAKEAADILEKFIEKAKMMGSDCMNCRLVFKPTLAQAMANTMKQLLGMRMGGSGAGLTGQTGIYGRMPATALRRGGGQGRNNTGWPGRSSAGAGDNRNPNERGPRGVGARGSGSGNVPVQYKTRVDAYFERVADELGER